MTCMHALVSVLVVLTITVSVRPSEVQASIGLSKCMTALKTMETIWPSAGRAWELLHGSKVEPGNADVARLEYPADVRRKRAAHDTLEDRTDPVFTSQTGHIPSQSASYSSGVGVDHQYYSTYDSRWPGGSTYNPPQPMHAPGQIYPSRVETNMIPPIEPFITGSNGQRYPGYTWGEYQETFGEPAALQASLYDHPLNPMPRQPPAPSHFSEYSGQYREYEAERVASADCSSEHAATAAIRRDRSVVW